MTEYRLHCFAQSGNSYKVALMLELAGAGWEPEFVDFFNGENRSPEFRALVTSEGLEPAERYHAFIDVIEQDARAASAGLQLVLAQASMSSQLIDNMNASIHLRALLTDLFLIDEIVKRALAKSS